MPSITSSSSIVSASQIADGIITGAKLVNSTITTGKLATNAVTNVQSASASGGFTTTSTTYVDVTSISVTLTTTGANVLVAVNGCFNPNTNTGSDNVNFAIVEDGTGVFYQTINQNAVGLSAVSSFAILSTRTPAAGSHTYKLQVKTQSGNTLNVGGTFWQDATATNIVAMEVKV